MEKKKKNQEEEENVMNAGGQALCPMRVLSGN